MAVQGSIVIKIKDIWDNAIDNIGEILIKKLQWFRL